MLTRFCLFGFLKNQRYHDPFIVLAFMEQGWSFFEIGALIATRELAQNIMEIPSGVLADHWGRRRVMMISAGGAALSFLTLGLGGSLGVMFLAMAMLGAAEAFRTGTHKAMIFSWLRSLGREEERTKIYGQTRSWSKLGSALSVLIAAALVFSSGGYQQIFLLSAVPSALNVINFLGYPAELDERGSGERPSLKSRLVQLGETLKRPTLRALILESMAFEGSYKAAKDYLQPLLLQVATVGALAGLFVVGDAQLGDTQRVALVSAPVFLTLHLVSAVASKRAHLLTKRWGEARASWGIWAGLALVSLGLLGGLSWGLTALSVSLFVLMAVLQNLWRPIVISRFDTHGAAEHGAAVLSVESQAKGLATLILAPGLGWLVDTFSVHDPALWPVAAVCLAISLVALISTGRRRRSWISP